MHSGMDCPKLMPSNFEPKSQAADDVCNFLSERFGQGQVVSLGSTEKEYTVGLQDLGFTCTAGSVQ